ncbi:MAG: hypothetical protein U0235_31305 [Polyangiaceae bacterium]
MRLSTFAAVFFVALGIFGVFQIAKYRSSAHAAGAAPEIAADAGAR